MKLFKHALSGPNDVAVDGSGNLYIADQNNNRIRKVTPGGIISTYAGTGAAGSAGDGGSALNAQVHGPAGLAFDASGRLYVSEYSGHRVRVIATTATGTLIQTVAGNGASGNQGDGGLAVAAELGSPEGLVLDTAGNLYVVDSGLGQCIRKITPGGIISTVAGATHFAGDGGPAIAAQLSFPQSVAADVSGNLYIADTSNQRIRQVTPDGNIHSLSGVGTPGFSGDGGAASTAMLNNPGAVTSDNFGTVYVADTSNNRIRKITPTGTISTIAGNGSAGSTGDGGPATSAALNTPVALALDSGGNLYIADEANNRIRSVSPQGIITTIAGTGTAGFGGDGGIATEAQLNEPGGIAVDSAGNLYIADQNNYRIRRVDANGTITTVAGTGQDSSGGDGGLATAASVAGLGGLAADNAGNIFIACPGAGKIRMVNSSGIIQTVVGTGTRSSTGDGGLGVSATLGAVGISGYQLAVGPSGVVYLADTDGEEIRKLTPNVPSQLIIVSGNNQTAPPSTLLPNPLLVTVQDPSGVGVPGTPVSFAVTSGSAKLSVASTVTDSTGRAAVGVTLGATAGPVTVTAAAAGLPSVAFNLTATTVFITSGVLNAASLLSAPLSPGEIVTINGTGLGPAQPISQQVTGTGVLSTNLGGTQVLFDDTPAALISVQANQVTAIVPYEVDGEASTQLQIVVNGVNSSPTSVPVANAAPGIYTQDSSGSGPGMILNADGSTNSPSNPASVGSVVTINATGEGQTNPPGVDGLVAGDSPPMPTQQVSVQIGNATDATVVSAGGISGVSAGFFQVSVQIPADAPTGSAVPITITVGGVSSQSGVTISIQ